MNIDVLDAVYDLESTEPRWLEELAQRATASVAGALGGVAFSFRGGTAGATPVNVGGSIELLDVPRQAHAAIPARELATIYGEGPRSGPSSDYFRAAGLPMPGAIERLYRALGIADVFAVTTSGVADTEITVGVALDPRAYPRRATHDWRPLSRSWDVVAAHLAQANQLRHALRDGGAAIEGRFDAHGRGDVADTAAAWRDQIAEHVRRSERARAAEVPDGECRWDHLLDGAWSVVRRRAGGGSIEYLAIRNPSAALRRLTAFERRLIRLATTGEYNTQIAKELRVHESTVSRVLSRALRKLGLASRADLILLHAALAPAGSG